VSGTSDGHDPVTSQWTFAGEPTVRSLAGGSTTLVEGASFSISASSGDIEAGSPHGLFFEDTRFVSTWTLRLDGEELQSLATIPRAISIRAAARSRGSAPCRAST